MKVLPVILIICLAGVLCAGCVEDKGMLNQVRYQITIKDKAEEWRSGDILSQGYTSYYIRAEGGPSPNGQYLAEDVLIYRQLELNHTYVVALDPTSDSSRPAYKITKIGW